MKPGDLVRIKYLPNSKDIIKSIGLMVDSTLKTMNIY